MFISYDNFIGAFLSKITEFEFASLLEVDREEIVEGYMKRSISAFKKNCKRDFITTSDDEERQFNVDIPNEEIDELIDIISEGMVVQWLKPYVYKQENLENALSTRDYSVYSPAELLMRVGNAYNKAQKDFVQMIREYSYNNNDLTVLHL